MAITVRLPGQLRQWADGQRQIELQSNSVAGALQLLGTQYPGVGERILDDDGQPRRFVNVYVNDQDIQYLQRLDTPVGPNDTVIILPAMAGGQVGGHGTDRG